MPEMSPLRPENKNASPAESPSARASHLIENSFQTILLRSGNGDLSGVHANKFALSSLVFKLHDAIDHSEQGIVFAAADVAAGLPFRAALSR